MNKFLALIPFFCFAACSAIKIDYTKQANAGETGGVGGANASSGSGANGGSATSCTCESEVEKDGARLKRQYLIGDDGSKMVTDNWTDTEIGETCSFQKLPNGDTRCVPDHVQMNTFLDSLCKVPFYLKAACTDPSSPACKEKATSCTNGLACSDVEFPNSDCVPTPRYARLDVIDSTDTKCHAQRVGFEIYGIDINSGFSKPSPIYTRDTDGACVLGSIASYFDYKAYNVYKIGDASKFVSTK